MKLLEKAQEVVCEALKVQTQREEEWQKGRRLEALQSEAASCSAAHSPRNGRVDASPESCGPVGGRSEAKSLVGHRKDFRGDWFEPTNRSPRASASFWVRSHRDDVGASLQVRICVDVRFDRGGRQKTPRSRCAMKWCKSVGARYRHRGVRVGEATNPGPPKWLHRSLASASQPNRFEILSSSSGVFRSSSSGPGGQRVTGTQTRWAFGSGFSGHGSVSKGGFPAVQAMPAPTVGNTDTDIPHHVIGTRRDSDTDETMSLGQISGDGVVGVGEIDCSQPTAMKPCCRRSAGIRGRGGSDSSCRHQSHPRLARGVEKFGWRGRDAFDSMQGRRDEITSGIRTRRLQVHPKVRPLEPGKPMLHTTSSVCADFGSCSCWFPCVRGVCQVQLCSFATILHHHGSSRMGPSTRWLGPVHPGASSPISEVATARRNVSAATEGRVHSCARRTVAPRTIHQDSRDSGGGSQEEGGRHSKGRSLRWHQSGQQKAQRSKFCRIL